MPYKFAQTEQDYAHFASGRILYHSPGSPAFPLRLAAEIFQRARALLARVSKINIYDPTCGSAYHLAALALLFGPEIGSISASDVNPAALDLARRNLGLLSDAGLKRREAEIRGLLEQYGKESHREALSSIEVFRERIQSVSSLTVQVFQANALVPEEMRQGLRGQAVDLVIADVPYGQMSGWSLPGADADLAAHPPVWRMLDALLPVLPAGSVIAIAADKSQKITHDGYCRMEHFKVGKRQVHLLTPVTAL